MSRDIQPSPAYCNQRVYTNHRWDFGGHRCQRKVAVVIDGIGWCSLHSPEGKAKKREKDDEAYRRRRAIENAHYEKEAEKDRRAEAYPRLIEFVRHCSKLTTVAPYQEAEAILRELGESADAETSVRQPTNVGA